MKTEKVTLYFKQGRSDKVYQYDGKRLLLHKVAAQGETVIAINRTGRSVGAPDVILQRAGSSGQIYLVDGEAVGETLYHPT